MMGSWRAGEQESRRAGELESWRAGEMERQRAGETESRRDGEQEIRRAGEQESRRELMATGKVKKEVADQLGISYHSVALYTRNIYKKLESPNITAAVATAIRRGLI